MPEHKLYGLIFPRMILIGMFSTTSASPWTGLGGSLIFHSKKNCRHDVLSADKQRCVNNAERI